MLSIQGVSKFYAGKTALSDISFDAGEGKIFGLLGPNGAGKTSLIRIITRITAPDRGAVLFQGKPSDDQIIQHIGYLPEERGLYRKMSILDQAVYFARLKGMSRQDAVRELDTWFERLDMKGWKSKKVDELSKGMQQKVQFVLTVLHKPELLILDEPFTGFDPINAAVIKKEILNLRANGATVILSTHRMESVEELCDDIGLINNSKLVITGKLEDVRRRFSRSEFYLTFEGDLKAVEGVFTYEYTSGTDPYSHAVIRVSNNDKDPNVLLSRLISQVKVHEFREIIPTVNDIFIELVKGEAS